MPASSFPCSPSETFATYGSSFNVSSTGIFFPSVWTTISAGASSPAEKCSEIIEKPSLDGISSGKEDNVSYVYSVFKDNKAKMPRNTVVIIVTFQGCFTAILPTNSPIAKVFFGFFAFFAFSMSAVFGMKGKKDILPKIARIAGTSVKLAIIIIKIARLKGTANRWIDPYSASNRISRENTTVSPLIATAPPERLSAFAIAISFFVSTFSKLRYLLIRNKQ